MSEEVQERSYIVELSQTITDIRNLFRNYANKIKVLQDRGKESKLDDNVLAIPQKFAEMFDDLIPKEGIEPGAGKTWEVVSESKIIGAKPKKNYKQAIADFFDFVRDIKRDEKLFNNLKDDPIYYHYCKLCQALYNAFSVPLKESQRSFFEHSREILEYCSSTNFAKGYPDLAPKNIASVFNGVNTKMKTIDGQFKQLNDKAYDDVENNLKFCEQIVQELGPNPDLSDTNVQMKLELLGPPIITSSEALKNLDDFDPNRDTKILLDEIGKYSQAFFSARSATLEQTLADIRDKTQQALADKVRQEVVQDRIENYQADKIEFEAFCRSIIMRITELEKTVTELEILQRGLSGFSDIKEDLNVVDAWFQKEEYLCAPVQFRMSKLAQSDMIDNDFKMAALIIGSFGKQLVDENLTEEDHKAFKVTLESLNVTSNVFSDMLKDVNSFTKFDFIFSEIEKHHKNPQNIPVEYMQVLKQHLVGDKKNELHQDIKQIALDNVQAAHDKGSGISNNFLDLLAGKNPLYNKNKTVQSPVQALFTTLRGKVADEARWDLYLKDVYEYDKQEFCEWSRTQLIDIVTQKVPYYRARVQDFDAVQALKLEILQIIKDLKSIKNSVYYSTAQQRIRCQFLMHQVDDFIADRMRWIYKLIERLFELFRMKNESKLPDDLIAIRASRRYQDALKATLETQRENERCASQDPVDKEVAKMVAAQDARNSMHSQKTILDQKVMKSLKGRGFFGKGSEAKKHLHDLAKNSDLSYHKRRQPQQNQQPKLQAMR